MATLAQLENQIQKLQRRADVLREQKSMEAIQSIREMMDAYGLTVADLAKAGIGSGPKRGRPPGSKNGANGKSNGQVKSRLPPKYRDPASDATWSGHARPPAWIKDAPDRSVYLIGKAGKAAKGKGAGRARAAKKAASKGRQAAA